MKNKLYISSKVLSDNKKRFQLVEQRFPTPLRYKNVLELNTNIKRISF